MAGAFWILWKSMKGTSSGGGGGGPSVGTLLWTVPLITQAS
jgi:hypothetical protein